MSTSRAARLRPPARAQSTCTEPVTHYATLRKVKYGYNIASCWQCQTGTGRGYPSEDLITASLYSEESHPRRSLCLCLGSKTSGVRITAQGGGLPFILCKGSGRDYKRRVSREETASSSELRSHSVLGYSLLRLCQSAHFAVYWCNWYGRHA
ncbi:hypothetical protein J6590_005895 [Homalodisca vitripennis]|nr:hypothetical protein J6590_005895 [Homalodisca vitripennis]